jgi:ComF family protein
LTPFLKRLENLIFPPLCIICDNYRINDNDWFCPECLNTLLENHKNRKSCPHCSLNKLIRECTCEFLWEFPYHSIRSFLDYDEKVKTIMHHIKYFNKRNLAFYIGSLFSVFIEENFFRSADYIIPVPLHWLRKYKRGYNQAEWFARGIIYGRDKPVLITSGLYRKKRTRTQVKLDKADRRKNVQGAFGITDDLKRLIKDKDILLVDDVITTGATTAACAEILLESGCQKVRVLSLARD